MRTIVKHANRRLYDAHERRAITLVDVSELVISGELIVVVDKASGEDITVVTLLQSVLERLRRRSSGELDGDDIDRLVAALRSAMVAGQGTGDTYDADGPGTSAGTAGGAA